MGTVITNIDNKVTVYIATFKKQTFKGNQPTRFSLTDLITWNSISAVPL